MDTVTITISPPLPCGVMHGEHICGVPAIVAQATRRGSEWQILPMCFGCVLALGAPYDVVPQRVSHVAAESS